MRVRRPLLVLSTALIAVVTSTFSVAPADAKDVGASSHTQLIVHIDPAITNIERINHEADTSTADTSDGATGSYLLDVAAGEDPVAIANTIATLRGVISVSQNKVIKAPDVNFARIYAWRIYAWTTDQPVPLAGQYAAAAVNLPAAQLLSTGRGVVVAVLDTGVQLDPGPHPALAASLVAGIDLVDGNVTPAETRNGIDDDGNGLIDEGVGHGTHVAGIVHQVAPDAQIMPVRVLNDDGSGTVWNVSQGMLWAAAHGAKVINLSLGTYDYDSMLRDAVSEVTSHGVVVVAAAGNDGTQRPMYPAAAPGAIAVGSVGSGDVVSTFSNFGRWVDVMAPGEDIHSSYAFPADSYASASGTSMATPWVAGEAALLISKNPSLSPRAVSTAISTGSHSIDALNPSKAGLIGGGRAEFATSLRQV